MRHNYAYLDHLDEMLQLCSLGATNQLISQSLDDVLERFRCSNYSGEYRGAAEDAQNIQAAIKETLTRTEGLQALYKNAGQMKYSWVTPLLPSLNRLWGLQPGRGLYSAAQEGEVKWVGLNRIQHEIQPHLKANLLLIVLW